MVDAEEEYVNGICRCWYCGQRLDKDEEEQLYLDKAQHGDLFCYQCYHEKFEFTCCHCQEYDHIDNRPKMLVVFEPEDAGLPAGWKPGVYEILHLPYYADGMIEVFIYKWALAYLGPLPAKADSHDYACGHLCYDCQGPYVLIGDEW